MIGTAALSFFDDRPAETSGPARPMLLTDPRSLELLGRVERVARSDATVVIIGETGTGKELVARHIHANSGRRGPFVAVNCGALAESLVDAELFGHEAGAFTGAQGARAGWFEAANGGTLFLDEIGELPQPQQVKLLRVLQERQVVRIGSRRPIPVNVRLVAATNVDLARAVEEQQFRADLYYRLNVCPLRVPPLRERPGDILPLARHFIQAFSARALRPAPALLEDARQALLAHEWPGNVRELENTVQTALILARGRPLGASDLRFIPSLHADASAAPGATSGAPEDTVPDTDGPDAQPPQHSLPASAAAHAAAASPSGVYEELAAGFERLIEDGDGSLFQSVEEVLVRTAYARCRENQVHAARALGITRNMLRTLLKRYGLLELPAHAAPVSRAPLRFPPAQRA